MTQAQVLANFKKFLVIHSCFDEYMENFKSNNVFYDDFDQWANALVFARKEHQLISSAFNWKKTKSDHKHWSNIHKMWLSELELTTKKEIQCESN